MAVECGCLLRGPGYGKNSVPARLRVSDLGTGWVQFTATDGNGKEVIIRTGWTSLCAIVERMDEVIAAGVPDVPELDLNASEKPATKRQRKANGRGTLVYLPDGLNPTPAQWKRIEAEIEARKLAGEGLPIQADEIAEMLAG